MAVYIYSDLKVRIFDTPRCTCLIVPTLQMWGFLLDYIYSAVLEACRQIESNASPRLLWHIRIMPPSLPGGGLRITPGYTLTSPSGLMGHHLLSSIHFKGRMESNRNNRHTKRNASIEAFLCCPTRIRTLASRTKI